MGSELPALQNAAYPVEVDDESLPGIGRQSALLRQNRKSSGGLSDDPSESGAPVIDSHPIRGAASE